MMSRTKDYISNELAEENLFENKVIKK